MAEDKTSRAVSIDIIKGAVQGAVAAAPSGDPKVIVAGAAVGALGGGGAEMMARAIASFRPGNEAGFHEAHGELAARAVESRKKQLDEKIKALEAKIGADEAASAVPPITNAWARSWAKAEGKKQRVLMAALVSAFDPESYEAAMSHRFFRLIDELDYPEIRELSRGVAEYRKQREFRADAWTLAPLSVDSFQPNDAGSLHRQRLSALDLACVLDEDRRIWWVSWLGLELVAFLERGGFRDATATPDE